MILANRRAAAILALALLAWAGGCGRGRTPQGDWPLGFHLEVDADFRPSGMQRPNGEGSLYFLHGDEPDQPRLVVRKRRLRLSLQETLEESLELGEGPRVLEQGEPFRVQALNAAGLGARQRVMPFPEADSSLVLLFDTRVFLVGDFSYAFHWQQPPGDSDVLRRYEGWLRHLRFASPDSAGITGERP